MAGRVVYNPDGFRNLKENNRATGFAFQFKAQYYRGMTLSIVRDIKIEVDGEPVSREAVRVVVNGQAFTLEEMRTVVSPLYRWEFGEYAEVLVDRDGGLQPGKHHIKAVQVIAPSYMPMILEPVCETDFVIQ